jgi:hypothetical protein
MSLLLTGAGGTGGNTAPIVVTMVVSPNGTTFTFNCNQPVNCSSSAGLTFKDGASTYTLTYVSGSGTLALVFTIGTTVDFGDVCTCSYVSGSGNIVGTNGSIGLASFTNVSVTNNSTQGEVSAPTVSSATVASNGTTFTVAFSENVNCTSAAGIAFTDVSGLPISYTSGTGTSTLVFTLGSTVQSGDTCTWSYSQTSGNIVASGTGHAPLASFTNASVTNNSTQGGGGATFMPAIYIPISV